MATTWSTTNKNARVVLSNGNLTAASDTTASTYEAGRTDVGIASSGQKIYFEATCDVSAGSGNSAIGICDSSETFGDGTWLGSLTGGYGLYPAGLLYNNSASVTLANYAQGDTVCIAVIGGSKVWFRTNGGNWNNDVIANQNPATNTGGVDFSAVLSGTVYPAYNCFDNAGTLGQWTANFSGITAQTVPVGFSTFDVVLMPQAVM